MTYPVKGSSNSASSLLQGQGFWLETAGDDLTPRAAIKGDEQCDVAILGGGYSGLWTAYFLLCQRPDLRVAIVEREICGYGASGRNGGWCSPRFPVDAHALISRFGLEIARKTLSALQDMVDEIGILCDEEGIDAHYRKTGLLSLARTPGQMRGLVATQRTFERLGFEDSNILLNKSDAYARVHVTNLEGALSVKAGASIHPGRLVRQLARAVERRGGVIFEQTTALNVRSGSDAGIETGSGFLRAKRAVVTAGEAYLANFPGRRRSLLPMSSMIVLTEPLTEQQWEQVGWAGGESLSSQVHTKNYLTKTQDGRILFGSRGARYQMGSRISEEALCDDAIYKRMRDDVREWWPDIADIRFTHCWGGYLGVPRDWMPTVNFNIATRIGTLQGYTGRGVATSALSAKLLASLILENPSELSTLPYHRPITPKWEHEPFRWIGVRYVQNAFERIDAAESAGLKLPIDTSIAEALGEQ